MKYAVASSKCSPWAVWYNLKKQNVILSQNIAQLLDNKLSISLCRSSSVFWINLKSQVLRRYYTVPKVMIIKHQVQSFYHVLRMTTLKFLDSKTIICANSRIQGHIPP